MRGLAIGYDWLGEAMTPEQKAAWAETSAGYVRNMIAEVSGERIWWRPYHNFMGVAMGAAGMPSLSLQDFYTEEASEWTACCADAIDLWFRSGFDARGAYVEGTSYGIYGLSNALRFADAVQTLVGLSNLTGDEGYPQAARDGLHARPLPSPVRPAGLGRTRLRRAVRRPSRPSAQRRENQRYPVVLQRGFPVALESVPICVVHSESISRTRG